VGEGAIFLNDIFTKKGDGFEAERRAGGGLSGKLKQ